VQAFLPNISFCTATTGSCSVSTRLSGRIYVCAYTFALVRAHMYARTIATVHVPKIAQLPYTLVTDPVFTLSRMLCCHRRPLRYYRMSVQAMDRYMFYSEEKQALCWYSKRSTIRSSE